MGTGPSSHRSWLVSMPFIKTGMMDCPADTGGIIDPTLAHNQDSEPVHMAPPIKNAECFIQPYYTKFGFHKIRDKDY